MHVAGRLKKRHSNKQQEQEPHAKHSDPPYAARNGSLDVYEKPGAALPRYNAFPASIIPDPLNELPTWYLREIEAATEAATASATQFALHMRARHPLHNPSGPRRYRNRHLLPPGSDGRPPSVFSPSFPPMASAPERGHDPSRMAGPSRTPSGSPLPTPSSSQIRIQEPTKPRSRKISQGTYDHADMVEKTDPWSPNGQHDHKVDPDSPVSPTPPPNQFSNRPRRASLTQGFRHRTTAPSPLSQSTSAVHLHVIDPAQIQLPRKLSKRRKPFTGLFGGPEDGVARPQITRRQSTIAPLTHLPSLHGQEPIQKSKQGSILGRLVKRFSVLRKTDKPATQNGYGTDWHHANSLEPSPMHSPTSPQPPDSQEPITVHPSRTPEPVRRVPPPSIEVTLRDPPVVGYRRSSESISIHEIRTSGRLTIVNPDDPGSGDSTPQGATTPVPMPSVPGAWTSIPSSKEDLPLPNILRTDSPQSVSSLRPRSVNPADAASFSAPPPPPSPPLPDLPPPTPTPALQTLIGSQGSPGYPAVVLPPSPPPAHVRDGVSYVASPASTITALPTQEDITLARASMFVNPPTPYAVPAPLVTPPAMVMPEGQASSKRPDRSSSKSKEGASRSKSTRQTETFKLVRSPSATMKPSEVIMGMGEQWEVVGATAGSPRKPNTREKSKSSDREQVQVVHREESRRRREPSVHREENGNGRYRDRTVHREENGRHRDRSVHREESGRWRDNSSSAEEGDSRHKRQLSTSTGGREKPPSIASVRSTQTPVAPRRSVKKVSDAAEERRTSKASSANIPASVVMSGQERQGRERHLSVTATTRPNSVMNSAAEFESVGAQAAWDRDRLLNLKARSMIIGPDGKAIVSTPPTIGSDSRPSTYIDTELQRVSSIPSVATVAEMQKVSPPPTATHGSSHTYVTVVQTPPYQSDYDDGESLLPYMSPTPRHSTMSTASQFYRHTGYAYNSYVPSDPRVQNPLPNPPRLSSYQQSPLPMEVTNPLPQPPRLSSYKPAPLPASLTDTPSATWRSP